MGFNPKHMERDLHLPKHRQKLKNTIEKDLLNDENVIAIFYGGSLGNKNVDLYSDIDLRIVVKDEVYEQYVMNKRNGAKKWGNVLFFEDHPATTYNIAHYDTFVKVDTFYYVIENVKPSVWLQNIKIVYDSTGKIADILKKSMKLAYFPTAQEIAMWRAKLFAYLHEAYRRIKRGELYYALNCIDSMRLSIVTGWYMEAEIQPNSFGDWAKVEGTRSPLNDEQLVLLRSWHCGPDCREMMTVIKSIVSAFKNLHKDLCKKVNIEENIEWIDEVINKVM